MSSFNYYVNSSGMELIVPKGSPAPPGYSLIPTASTTNLVPVPGVTKATFTSGGKDITISIGQAIPVSGLKPKTSDPNVIYGYLQTGGTILYYDTTQYAPIKTTFFGVFNNSTTTATTASVPVVTTTANQPSSDTTTTATGSDTGPLVFVNNAGVETTVIYGGTIPALSTPKNGNTNFDVIYKIGSDYVQLSSVKQAPPLALYYGVKSKTTTVVQPVAPVSKPSDQAAQVSTGGTYVAPSGVAVQVPAGTVVPAVWSPTVVPIVAGTANNIIVAPDSTVAGVQQIEQNIETTGSPIVSDGGYYQNPDGGQIVQVPAGNPIPAAWVKVTDYITDDQKNNAIVAPAINYPPTGSPIMDAVGKILAIAGIGVIGYIGYLFVYQPKQLQAYIEKLKTIKELAVDAAYIAGAVAFLAALSFVSYEFMVSYEKTGTVGGAIGDMLAETLEFLAGVLIDTFEQLAKDLWEWIKKELTDLWNTINPF